MQIKYFKTEDEARAAISKTKFLDTRYPNGYQDSASKSNLKLMEFDKGFAWQRGDYGPYLEIVDFDEAIGNIQWPQEIRDFN